MMTDHPSFLNIHKLFFILVASPFLFLLLLSLIDVFWQHVMFRQLAEVSCTQATVNEVIKFDSNACQE
jgi:hypothetical protein